MEKLFKRSSYCFVMLFFAGMFLFSGCAHEARKPGAVLDSPEHHVFSGLKLLDDGRVEDAQREFELAAQLDSKYSPAYYGLGLALGHKKKFKPAFEAMKQAKKYSKNKKEKAKAYVGFMRLYLLQKSKTWFDDAEENFRKAMFVSENLPEAHYYMGVAYKEAYRFRDAEKEFKNVLNAGKTHILDADRQLKLVQKIERAMPGTNVGKKLALKDKITRADTAAIFIHELKLDKLYEKAHKSGRTSVTIPQDIVNHPLKSDIETVIRIGLRGLEVSPDGNFHPDHFIPRKAYAMMVEDIIATMTHDTTLSTKYIGYPSPFPDIRPDAPYFNAVMVCTTRGIMDAENMMTGEFNPEGSVSGADALLVIRNLRENQ